MKTSPSSTEKNKPSLHVKRVNRSSIRQDLLEENSATLPKIHRVSRVNAASSAERPQQQSPSRSDVKPTVKVKRLRGKKSSINANTTSVIEVGTVQPPHAVVNLSTTLNNSVQSTAPKVHRINRVSAASSAQRLQKYSASSSNAKSTITVRKIRFRKPLRNANGSTVIAADAIQPPPVFMNPVTNSDNSMQSRTTWADISGREVYLRTVLLLSFFTNEFFS
jgi:hypothetical protein